MNEQGSAGQETDQEDTEGRPSPSEGGGVQYETSPLLRISVTGAWSRLADRAVTRRQGQGAGDGTQDHP